MRLRRHNYSIVTGCVTGIFAFVLECKGDHVHYSHALLWLHHPNYADWD